MTSAFDLAFDEDQILSSDINGFVAVADIGAVAPASADITLDGDVWTSVGLIKDDGISESYNKDQEEKSAWNVRGTVKRIPKTAKFSFKFTAIQTNAINKELQYGNAPAAITGHTGHFQTKILAKSDTTERAWLIHVPMVDGSIRRIFVPRGVVSDVGDVVHSETDDEEFACTVGAVVSPGVDYLALEFSNAPGLSA